MVITLDCSRVCWVASCIPPFLSRFVQVTQMAYCKATKMIISADYHGGVVITSEIQCKLKEVRSA